MYDGCGWCLRSKRQAASPAPAATWPTAEPHPACLGAFAWDASAVRHLHHSPPSRLLVLLTMAADLQTVAQLLQASLDPKQNKQGAYPSQCLLKAVKKEIHKHNYRR